MSFEDYDNYSENYDSRYHSDMSERENSAVRALLNPYIREWDNVLDLGCGTGFALEMCTKMKYSHHGIRYIGIDVSKNMIQKARKKYPEKVFINKDIVTAIDDSEIDLPYFDVVLSLFSIPYIGLESINPVLNRMKDSGHFIAVYYDRPYLNPDSVYHHHRLKYELEVKPYVDMYISSLKDHMKVVEEGFLTDDKTYKYGVFTKS